MSQSDIDALSPAQKNDMVQALHRHHFEMTEKAINRCMTDFMNGRLIHRNTGKVMEGPVEDMVAIVCGVDDSVTPEPIRQKLLDEGKEVDVSVEFRASLVSYMKANCDASYQPAIKLLMKRPKENSFYCVCFDQGRCTVYKQLLAPAPPETPAGDTPAGEAASVTATDPAVSPDAAASAATSPDTATAADPSPDAA
jgi:hypothetical protein